MFARAVENEAFLAGATSTALRVVTDALPEEPEQPVIPVIVFYLNKSATSIKKGDTEQLTVTIAPATATNKDVTWTSSVPAVATVSSGGLVTAVAAGKATITVTTVDGAKTATCEVTVTENVVEPPPVTGLNIPAVTFGFNVFPNPFTGAVRIVGIYGVETRHATSVQLQVINAAGAIVHTQLLTSNDETVSLEHLPVGVYLFRVEKDGDVLIIRAVKN